MPPNLPIVERIAAEIAATISSIAEGEEFNYSLNAVRPVRVPGPDDEWDDLDVLIVQADENGRPKSSGAYKIVSPRQQFNLYAIAIESDKASTPIDTKCNKIGSDIVTKLKEDPRRNNLAEDTDILNVETFVFDTSFSGILVRIEVRFNIHEDDPTVKS